jgi:hypothetical protein
MSSEVSVTLDSTFDEFGKPAFALKISDHRCELNVWMTSADLALVSGVRLARWSERGSIRIGKSANSQAFWSCEDGSLSILIGHDDETYDFGITVPEVVLNDILEEISRETQSRKT